MEMLHKKDHARRRDVENVGARRLVGGASEDQNVDRRKGLTQRAISGKATRNECGEDWEKASRGEYVGRWRVWEDEPSRSGLRTKLKVNSFEL